MVTDEVRERVQADMEAARNGRPPDEEPKEGPFAVKKPRKPRSDIGKPRGPRTPRAPRAPKNDPLPALFGLGWAALGYGIERQAPNPPGVAVGKVVQLQSSYAGDVLARTVKGSPAYKFIKPWLEVTTPYQEIAGLLLAPLLTAFIAMRPEIGQSPVVRGILVRELTPTIAFAKKKAEEQQAAVEQLDEFKAEAQEAASSMVDWILGQGPAEEEDVNPFAEAE